MTAEATTSLPVEKHRANVDDSAISLYDLTNDDDDEVTSFGFSSGYYDNDDDADSGDAWRPESSSSSSSSSGPGFHVDYLDSHLEDNPPHTDTRPKVISRTLSTTPAVRTMFSVHVTVRLAVANFLQVFNWY